MSSQYVIITAYPADGSTHDDVVQGLGESSPSRKLYRAVDGAEVVELHALDDLGQIKDLVPQWSAQKQAEFMHLTGDVRRQVLSFVEAPKDCTSRLPESQNIQLRYVEVKPPSTTPTASGASGPSSRSCGRPPRSTCSSPITRC